MKKKTKSQEADIKCWDKVAKSEKEGLCNSCVAYHPARRLTNGSACWYIPIVPLSHGPAVRSPAVTKKRVKPEPHPNKESFPLPF